MKGTNRTQFVVAAGAARQDGEQPQQQQEQPVVVARLPSDMALLDNPQYAELVRLYARDEPTFLRDFARAFQRVLQLGAGEQRVGSGGGGTAPWTLRPDEFVWLGLSGGATNYGAAIEPI